MEVAWLLLLTALVLPLTILVLFHGGKSRRRLPPGPAAVPLLGNLVWLTPSSVDPRPILRRLHARHGPLLTLRVGSRLQVTVTDRGLAHTALVERGAELADRPGYAVDEFLGLGTHTISNSSYGPRWRLFRRHFVSEVAHPSRVRLFAPARSWVLGVLTDKLRREEDASIMEALQYAMFCLLVLMCFGERLEEAAVRDIASAERDLLIYSSTKLNIFTFFPAVTKRLFRGRLQAMDAMRRRLKDIFLPLIDARREYKKQSGEAINGTTFQHSYVDTLLGIKLNDEGGRALTDDEVVALCSEFLNAGTDTTSTALQWIMAELVKNPAIQGKLHDEIKATCGDEKAEVTEEDVHKMPYLRAVVLEGLRRHPPAHFVLPHAPAEDMELGGYVIPKSAAVNFLVADMGMDEETWERPAEFVPERFLEGGDGEGVDITGTKEIKMMPFGVGRRICPGLGIATLHLEYFVANLVREFEWKEMDGEEVDMADKPEFTVVMKKPLRALLVPRR